MKSELIENGQNDMLSCSVIIGGQLSFAAHDEVSSASANFWQNMLGFWQTGVIIARWKEGAHHELSAVEMDGRGIAAAAAAAIISYRSMRETDEKRVQSLRTSQSTQLLS